MRAFVAMLIIVALAAPVPVRAQVPKSEIELHAQVIAGLVGRAAVLLDLAGAGDR